MGVSWRSSRRHLSNRIAKDELKPGDHIYSWRRAHVYAHHGIYVGDDKVIHFIGGERDKVKVLRRFAFSSSSSKARRLCQRCGDRSMLTGVIETCLDCFLSGRDLYIYLYGVTPQVVEEARGGTCTTVASDTSECVLHSAKYLLENGFEDYNIFKNNCEDFAIYCKTGLLDVTHISSGQAAAFVAKIASSIAGRVLHIKFTGTRWNKNFTGDTAVHSVDQITAYDIRDFVKIPVERLIALSSTDGYEPGAHSESSQEGDQLLQGMIAGSAYAGGRVI